MNMSSQTFKQLKNKTTTNSFAHLQPIHISQNISLHSQSNQNSHTHNKQQTQVKYDYRCEFDLPKFVDLNNPDECDYQYSAVGHMMQPQQRKFQKSSIGNQNNKPGYYNDNSHFGSSHTNKQSQSPLCDLYDRSQQSSGGSSSVEELDLFWHWFQENHDFKIIPSKPPNERLNHSIISQNSVKGLNHSQTLTVQGNFSQLKKTQNQQSVCSMQKSQKPIELYSQNSCANNIAKSQQYYQHSQTFTAGKQTPLNANQIQNNIQQQQNNGYSYSQLQQKQQTLKQIPDNQIIECQNGLQVLEKQRNLQNNQNLINLSYSDQVLQSKSSQQLASHNQMNIPSDQAQKNRKRKAEEANISQIITNGSQNSQVYKRIHKNEPLSDQKQSRVDQNIINESQNTFESEDDEDLLNEVEYRSGNKLTDQIIANHIHKSPHQKSVEKGYSSIIINEQRQMTIYDEINQDLKQKVNNDYHSIIQDQMMNDQNHNLQTHNLPNQQAKPISIDTNNQIIQGIDKIKKTQTQRVNFIEKNKQKIREMSDCTNRNKQPGITSGLKMNLSSSDLTAGTLDNSTEIHQQKPGGNQFEQGFRLNSEYLKKIRPKTVNTTITQAINQPNNTQYNKENAQPNNHHLNISSTTLLNKQLSQSSLQTPTQKLTVHNFKKATTNNNLQTPTQVLTSNSNLLHYANNLSDSFNSTLNLSAAKQHITINITNQKNNFSALNQSTAQKSLYQHHNLTQNANPQNQQQIQSQQANVQKQFLYEPCKFSQRQVRQWENLTGKVWYQLSPRSRKQANVEIAQLNNKTNNFSALNHHSTFNVGTNGLNRLK